MIIYPHPAPITQNFRLTFRHHANERSKKERSATENLYRLPEAVYLEKEMGIDLGGGKILFRKMQEKQTLILTLRLDPDSQLFFDRLRETHFPADRNYLAAHLTLFHQLPDDSITLRHLDDVKMKPFPFTVSGLMSIGRGVAYKISSPELQELHLSLGKLFDRVLIPQDRQPFRPHITVMNKSTPALARTLLAKLSNEFTAFDGTAIGMDLWQYEGGPWQHRLTIRGEPPPGQAF